MLCVPQKVKGLPFSGWCSMSKITLFFLWLIFNSTFPFALFYQWDLERWSQSVLSQLHHRAASQFLGAPCPLSRHRHADQRLLHHLHLRGHVGERAGPRDFQGSPVSAHVTHCVQTTARTDAGRRAAGADGHVEHDEDRCVLSLSRCWCFFFFWIIIYLFKYIKDRPFFSKTDQIFFSQTFSKKKFF